MAKRQKTATPQQSDREDMFVNRPKNMKAFYDIVNHGFPEPGSAGDDREKSKAVEGPDEVVGTEEELAETEAATGTEVKEKPVAAKDEEVAEVEQGEGTEEVEELEPPESEEGEYTDAVELEDGSRITVEDLEMMSKVFRDKDGKPLPIKDVVEVYNAGIDPVIFLRKGNEVRAGLTKDLTAKDAKITSLEQQIDALTQEAVEARRVRVAKPNASLLDSNPAAYNAQMLAYIDSKGETDTKVAELTGRRQQAQAKVEAEVQQGWDTWHREPENDAFLKNLSPEEKQRFEDGVLQVLQDSYGRTGILMPMAVPMQYTIARLQWEKKVKVDNLASASLTGAQAEQRKRMRLVKAAKTQISHGAITTSRAKAKAETSSPELRAKLMRAKSAGDQDEVIRILRQARFGE